MFVMLPEGRRGAVPQASSGFIIIEHKATDRLFRIDIVDLMCQATGSSDMAL